MFILLGSDRLRNKLGQILQARSLDLKSHASPLPLPIYGLLRCSHLGKGSPLALHQCLLGSVSDRRAPAAHPTDECLSLLLTPHHIL